MYLTVAVVGNGGKLLDATKGLSKYNAYDNENDDDNCFSVNTDYHELWIFVPKNEERWCFAAVISGENSKFAAKIIVFTRKYSVK